MKDWLAATAFLIGLSLVAAAVLLLGFMAVRALGLTPSTERVVVGWLGIVSLVLAMLAGRSVLRRLERRA